MSNVSLGLSSNAAGASQVVYTLKFTSSQAGALAAAAGQIFLTAPAGTMFPSMGGRFFVEDLSVKDPAPTAAEAQVSPAGNEATVTVPIAVGGGDRVSLTVDGVTNTGTEGPQRVTVSTSADTAPALAPTFNLAAPGAVSAPSLSISSDAGGADQVNYQMSFTTTRDGALVESLGEIVLSAPPGTVFPSVGSDYFVTDLTSHAPAASVSPAVAGGGAVVAVTVPGDIQAGDRVSLLVQGVVNSAEIAQVRTSLWTTSDTVPAVPTPAASEKPAPVAALSLGLSSDNGGAGGVSYQLRFTTSAHGSLVANKGDVTISAPPGTVFPVAPGDYSVSDLTSKSPVSTPGVSLSGTGNVATLQMSAAIAAGDRVSIDISGVTNPARGKAVVDLWTSSDLVPAVTSYDIVAASPVRDLSLTMSSQAASVSMVSYQVTFVPGPRGSLVASHGDITLLAPAGTSLPNAPPDYRVTDVTTGSGPQVPAGVTWGGDPNAGVRGANEATLTVPMAVAPGDKVVIVANGVTNPPVGRAALQLWTSSEKEPVPSRTFSFTPAKALSAAHLSTTPAVAPATGPTWVLGFRTGPEGGLGAGSGLITIEGPPGTVFPSVAGDYEVQTGATAPVNPDQVTVLGGGGLADLVPGSPVGPGAEVTVRVSDVTGTNGGRPAGQVRLSTSSQPAPEILSGSTHPVKTAAVTSPSVSVSAPEAGASMATYSLRFTTSPSGALAGPSAANPGTITVELPPGAAFACAAGECPFYDFAVNGQRSPSVALSPDSSAATLEVPAPIAPSQVVTASFFNVANTTVPGLHDLRVWTSSDPSAVSVPFDLAATSSVSAPSLALSTSAAGASFADYLLHFTTGPDGALPGSASGNAAPGTITLAAPPGTVFPDCFTIECGYEPSYWLTYGSGNAAPCSTSAPGGGCGIATGVLTDDGASVTISVSKPIPASTPVTLSIADVVNASLTGRGRALVSTSSQPRPVPVNLSLSTPASVRHPSLQIAPAAAGAQSGVLRVSFSTSPTGALESYVGGQKITGFESSPETIDLQAPPGTSFAASYLVDGKAALPGTLNGDSSVVTFGAPDAIGPSTPVSLVLTGVTEGPVTGTQTLTLWTSSDLVPVRIPYTLQATSPQTGATLRLSASAAEGPANYTLVFRTSSTGSLQAGVAGAGAGAGQIGSIYLEADPGTVFPDLASDYLVNGEQVADVLYSGAGSAVSLVVPRNIAASLPVTLKMTDVLNSPQAGPHHLSLWTSSAPSVQELAYRLTSIAKAAPVPPPPPPKKSPPPHRPSANKPIKASVFTSLPTPASAFRSVRHDLANAAVTVGALLFITFPSQLFNSTFEQNYEEIRGWWEKRLRRVARLRQKLAQRASRRRDAGVFVSVLLLGALLGNFINPHFAFDLSTLASYLAVVAAVSFGVYVSFAVNVAYRRKRHGRDQLAFNFRALPGGLAVAAFCVLVSRLADFAPGYLYGLICGIAFARELKSDEKGHIVALSTVTTMLFATGAWFVWVPVSHAVSGGNAGFPEVLLDDFLGSLFVSGLVGSVISMLPLRFLPGGDLAKWHRGVWVAVFGVAVFGMLQAMLRPASHSKVGHAPIVTVIILFIVFGGGSVAFREYFARHKKKTEAGHDEGEAGEPGLAPATAGPAPDPAPTGDAPGLPAHGD